MYLKSLSIYGFKTFAKRTVIDFKTGTTAIVGPNGSGKSNLIDAIMWALGEQSVKSIRGRKMEEVVFHGSTIQKPLGFAEVILTFDNEDGFFPLPQSEIAVMRRYYKSGDSEFAINRESCRLKDIQNLMIDTGLGASGYSIVNQGDVEYIIDLTPQQRREIFIETAGILKYRVEKTKTQQRIYETEQNINRLRDILNEIQETLEPLREQAEKAKRYEDIADEMERLKLGVFADEIRRLSEKLKQQTAEEAQIGQKQKDTQEAAEKLRVRQRELTVEMENDRRSVDSLLQELAMIGGRVARSEETTRFLSRSVEEIEGRIREFIREQSSIKAQADILRNEVVKLEEQTELKRGRLSEVKSEMARFATEVKDEFKTREKDLSASRQELLDKLEVLKEKETETLSRLSVARDRLNSLQSQIKDRTNDKNNLRIQYEKLKAGLDSTDSKIGTLEKNIKEKESLLEKQRKTVDKAASEKTERQAKLDEIAAQINSIQVRIGALEKIAGLTTAGFSGPRQGIEGKVSLSESVEIEEGYILAARRAIGELFNSIVVSQSDLKTILKEHKTSAGIFLISELAVAGPAPDFSSFIGKKGCTGLLSEKVITKDASLKSIFSRFIVVDCLKTFESMVGNLPVGAGMVTEDGDACLADGVLRIGDSEPTDEAIGERITTLKADLKESRKQEAERRKLLEAAEQEFKKVAMALSAAESELFRLREELTSLRGRLMSDTDRVELYSREIASIDASIGEWGSAAAELDATVKESQAILEKVREEKNGLEAELSKKKTGLDEIAEIHRKQETTKNELRVELGGLTREIEAADEAVRYRKAELERLNQRNEDCVKAEKEHGERRTKISLELEGATREMNEAKAAYEKATSDLSEKRAALEKSAELMTKLRTEIEDNERESAELRERLLESELKRARTETQLEDTRRQFTEEFPGMTEEEAIAKAGDSETGRKSRYMTLRRELESLLPVNQLAIGEYEEKSNRYDTLLVQVGDLEDTRTSLLEIMEEFDTKSRTQYIDTFEKIRDSFKETFLEMFGGGDAQLVMENGCDPLDAGIDMAVQIPGKRMRGITLLSGGEKSLCALVFIFSILKVRPSPFYILDEVDAGLDDTNIERFRDMLHKYSRDSQFIIVTHNKGTIAGADHFFGVTLKEEEGYSKILSVSID